MNLRGGPRDARGDGCPSYVGHWAETNDGRMKQRPPQTGQRRGQLGVTGHPPLPSLRARPPLIRLPGQPITGVAMRRRESWHKRRR